MRQGAIKHALKLRGDDLNETPDCATRALLRVESLPQMIWEPCAGRGAIARILTAAGHIVWATDLVAHPGADPGIETGCDFLLTHAVEPGFSTIVMNAPFKLDDEFVRHGLALGCRVFALFRLMYLEGSNRSDLIDTHLSRVWIGRELLPMMHREGYAGKRIDKGGMPFAWFVFDPDPRPPATPFLSQRMSWWSEAFPAPDRRRRPPHDEPTVDVDCGSLFRTRPASRDLRERSA